MPKQSAQLRVAVERRAPNSGIASVPKLNGATAADSFPASLSQLFGDFPGRDGHGNPQTFHRRGSLLFTEGQPASGVFIVEKGSLKVTVCSGRGKSLILGFFGPQSVLGLAAAILGGPHESTAETMTTVMARFVSRGDLLRQMHSAGVGLRVAELVSRQLYSTVREIEALWLTDSVEQRLARFFVSICPPRNCCRAPAHLALDLTHEDIAQRIGVSRESVTRFLSRFKKRRILDYKQSVLTVLDPAALERLADFSYDLPSPRARPGLSRRSTPAPGARLPNRQE
jgi:CRP/FNR family transcriptional regulator, cyclic AMP receptor protein